MVRFLDTLLSDLENKNIDHPILADGAHIRRELKKAMADGSIPAEMVEKARALWSASERGGIEENIILAALLLDILGQHHEIIQSRLSSILTNELYYEQEDAEDEKD